MLEGNCRSGSEVVENNEEKELEISDQNVNMDAPEERPGVGYEIFTIGTGI